MSNVQLAGRVNLSESACLRRVRALEESGMISRYAALLSQNEAGLPGNVFVQIGLHREVESELSAFEDAVRDIPEVMECYLMTGDSDYLLRVVAPDLKALQSFIVDRLARIPHVSNIRSSMTLKQVKYKTALPIELA